MQNMVGVVPNAVKKFQFFPFCFRIYRLNQEMLLFPFCNDLTIFGTHLLQ